MTSDSFGEGLVIVRATPNDFDEILNFMNTEFCTNEPITVSLDATPNEMSELVKGKTA